MVLVVCLAATAARAQTDVYVNLAYPGTEAGTLSQPFDTVAEGVNAVTPGGVLHVAPNDSHEVMTVSKATTLSAQSGTAHIGKLTSDLGSGAPLRWLQIVELMYNPAPGSAEYIELQNTGPAPIDLSGVFFSQGIVFTFPNGTTVLNGQRVVLVRDTDASTFASLYSGVSTLGVYSGALDNDGETLQLTSSSGVAFLTMTYDDAGAWPTPADGSGFSLVIRNTLGNSSDPANWRASTGLNGSPGAAETDPAFNVVINEALVHTDLPLRDSVEFRNVTAQPVDIRGWFITDTVGNPMRARIPNTAMYIIPAGGYAVIDDSSFNDNPGSVNGNSLPGFRLSEYGEDIFLFSANAAGQLTGYSHGFTFGGQANGVSFGRMLTSDGREHFVTQTARSLGSANPGPAIGAVVISEIYYNPSPGGIEYVEITNRTAVTVSLFDNQVGGDPTNTYHVAGIGFAFPPNRTLPPGGKALIVNASPSLFTPPAGVQVFGPFNNLAGANDSSLSDSGETLNIQWPNIEENNLAPYISMDEVRYLDIAPWPSADGNGLALHRTTLSIFGSEPSNWTAQLPTYHP